ncbi:hypothetical protein [Collimonas humicola]|uniref:hypothetical protein n=1 Tax=Collimonas humicola TaxID=2825886 RepID=UPI001B8BB7BC|nr:hypothetical protein [Collimonas humicola]
MARNKTPYLYSDTEKTQEWTVDSDGFVRETYKVEQTRKSFTISLDSNATIKFGANDAAYLAATHAYNTDSRTSHTDTTNEMSCATSQSAVNAIASCAPE